MIVSISSISYNGSDTAVASTTNQQVTTIINDTSSLTVSLAGPVQTVESDSPNIYTVNIDQAPTTDTVITLSYSGTATDVLIDSINHTENETIQLSISNKEVTTEVNDVILSGFTDSSLRTCIFNMLPANEAQLLTGISDVDCGNGVESNNNYNISNLSGLEQLTGLLDLILNNNQISDLSSLSRA